MFVCFHLCFFFCVWGSFCLFISIYITFFHPCVIMQICIVAHMCSYLFLSRYIQRGPFVHFLYVCVYMCSPLRTPPISAWQHDKFTLRSSPVDMQGAWKITIDIAMVTVALLLPETYNATIQCMPECVCVCVFVCAKVYVFVCERDGVGGSCCLQGLDVLFQRYSLRHSG